MKTSEIIKNLVKYSGFDFTVPSTTIMYKNSEYTTIENYPDDKKLRNHINNEYSICLTRYKHTKIYCIDVDFHDGNIEKAKSTIVKLTQLIGNPFFIEKSSSPIGGFHLYFKFKNYLYPNCWRNLQSYFKDKFDFTLESIGGNKKLKLPFSFNYSIYGSFDESKEDFINQKSISDCIFLFKDSESLDVPDFLNKLSFYKKESELIKVTKEDKISFWNPFYYSRGERNKTQFQIAVREASNNGTFESFKQECFLKDVGSKDMTTWNPSRIEDDLRHKWRNANHLRYNGFQNQKNVEKHNKDNLFLNIYDNLLTKENEFVLINILRSNYVGRKGKVKEKFINDCLLFYKIIISIYNYRKIHKYSYNDEFEFLNRGVPLSKKIRIKIAKNFKIKNHYKVYKYLLNNNFITLIKNKNGFSYSYKIKNWVQHFVINNIETIQKTFVNYITFFKKIFDNLNNFYYNNSNRNFVRLIL